MLSIHYNEPYASSCFTKINKILILLSRIFNEYLLLYKLIQIIVIFNRGNECKVR